MARPFGSPGDWAQMCVWFSGKAYEWDISEVQFFVIDHLLGLTAKETVSDEELANTYLPALLAALKNIKR